MPPQKAVAKCSNDGCPMRPFVVFKASHGWAIALHGCRFCDFDHVFAVASDATDRARRVAQWAIDPASGRYVLRKEHGPNPPGWLELTCSALPQRK